MEWFVDAIARITLFFDDLASDLDQKITNLRHERNARKDKHDL